MKAYAVEVIVLPEDLFDPRSHGHCSFGWARISWNPTLTIQILSFVKFFSSLVSRDLVFRSEYFCPIPCGNN